MNWLNVKVPRGRRLRKVISVIVMCAWFVSGWPQIPKTNFPPSIVKVRAAFPSVAATNSSQQGSVSTSHTVNLPSGISSGDLIIVNFGYAVTGVSITWPDASWNQFYSDEYASGGTNGVVGAWRKATGSEGSTINVTTGSNTRSVHTSYRITGADDPDTRPPEATTTTAANSNPDPPNLTPTGGAKDYLWIAVGASSHAGTYTAYPSGFSNGLQQATSSTAAAHTIIGSAELTENASSKDPGNFTHDQSSVAETVAVTIAVHPTASASFTQSAYRWRNDDGSESAATWKASENTTISSVSTSETIRLRIEAEETDSIAGTLNAKLEFSSDATSCTNGSWTALDTSTTAWRVEASANITNDDATTNQLTTSAKTFAAGNIFDTQNEDTTGVSLNNTHSEWEWAIRGTGAAGSTTYRFRVTDSGTALSIYTNCAQLTTAGTVSSLNQSAYRWRNDNGSETTASWKDSENTAITNVSTSQIIRLRIETEEVNNFAETVNARLQFSSDATTCTDGSWTTLDTSTTTWRVTASSNVTNDDPTTDQLTTSAKTFAAGNIFDTQNEDTTGVSLNNTHSEWEWAIRGDGAAASTSYRFRLTDAGTAYDTYTNCALLTTAANGYGQPNFRIRSGDAAGLNTDSDWAGVLNADVTMEAGKVFRIRFEVEENAGSGSSKTFKLQYRFKPNGSSYGSWTDAPDRGAGGEDGPIQTDTSSQYADEAAASTDLLSGSSESFDTGGTGQETISGGTESGRTVATAAVINSEHAEYEFALLIRGTWGGPNRMKDNDQLQFRMVETDNTVFPGVYTVPTITVDVPDGYIGSATIESPGRIGPFKDTNGNLYFLIEPTFIAGLGNNEPEFLKSTDGGTTWDLVDTGNSPGQNDLEAADVFQDGDTLHVCIQEPSVTYHTFRMSDHSTNPDSWNVKDESLTIGSAPNQQACNVIKRSDGTVVMFYRFSNGNQRVGYQIRSAGGTWGGEINLDNTASTDYVFSGAVLGASDKIHVFYRDQSNNDILHKSLSSSDTLSSAETVESNAITATDNFGTTMPVYWDDAGAEKIMILVQDQSTNPGQMYSVTITNDGSPETRKVVSASDVRNSPTGTASEQPVADLAVDTANDKQYALFAYSSDGDLYLDQATNDGGWGTDENVKTATNIDFVRGLIYTHSSGNGGNKVYGYWYDDNGAGDNGHTWYGEYDFGSTTFTQNTYRWYIDEDTVNPSGANSPWPSGSVNLAENTAIPVTPVAYDPPNVAQELRLRVNFTVNTVDLAQSSKYFKLQYRSGTDSSCGTGSWSDVGSGNDWEYASSSVADGADITAELSNTTSGKGEEYVKSNPSELNHVAASVAEIVEYDFHIIGTNSTTAERYLFRAVETDAAGTASTEFDGYTNCAILSTEPGPGNLMRHGKSFIGGIKQGFFWVD